jgi:hypothetical protein
MSKLLDLDKQRLDQIERDKLRRGARSCRSCHWFELAEPRQLACIRGNGWCKYRPPPASREWGKHIDPVNFEDWCSCWVPNLEEV